MIPEISQVDLASQLDSYEFVSSLVKEPPSPEKMRWLSWRYLKDDDYRITELIKPYLEKNRSFLTNDVVFKTHRLGRKVKCSTFILTTRSPVFDRRLRGSFQEARLLRDSYALEESASLPVLYEKKIALKVFAAWNEILEGKEVDPVCDRLSEINRTRLIAYAQFTETLSLFQKGGVGLQSRVISNLFDDQSVRTICRVYLEAEKLIPLEGFDPGLIKQVAREKILISLPLWFKTLKGCGVELVPYSDVHVEPAKREKLTPEQASALENLEFFYCLAGTLYDVDLPHLDKIEHEWVVSLLGS